MNGPDCGSHVRCLEEKNLYLLGREVEWQHGTSNNKYFVRGRQGRSGSYPVTRADRVKCSYGMGELRPRMPTLL